jgi:hypothetical protein
MLPVSPSKVQYPFMTQDDILTDFPHNISRQCHFVSRLAVAKGFEIVPILPVSAYLWPGTGVILRGHSSE